MRPCPARSSCSRNATITPLALVCLSLLAGMVALVVDGGTLMEDRRHVQAAADASALAAAADLFAHYSSNQGKDPSGTAQASALSTAAANGFSNDGVQSSITVNISPADYQSGPNAGKPLPPGYVEVIVQYNAGRLFSNVFGSGTIPVRARAVARGVWGPTNNGIMLLNLQASGALAGDGGGTLLVNGGLQVNSSSSAAISLTGGSTVTAGQLNLNQAAGPLASSLLTQLLGTGGSSPIINYGSPVPDPLRHLPDPDPVALGLPLQATNLQITSGFRNLYPGIYQGGISVSSGAIAILHANSNGTPGIYYLQGGGLTITGSSSVMGTFGQSAGIMIYNDWSKSSDAILLSGTGFLSLQPPTSGVYKGISIFQKRGTLATAAPSLHFSGSGLMLLTGTVYAAHAQVALSGLAGANVMSGQVIADTLSVSGNAAIAINPVGGPLANTRTLGLVE